MKKIAYDAMPLDELKIVEDSKCCLKVSAVITKAGVYKYEDGYARKSKMELLKATRSARFAKLTIGNHPDTKVIMSLKQVNGGVEKPFFDRNKIRAILSFDKYETPTPFIDKIRNAIQNNLPLDNSIGFYHNADWTPGFDVDVNTGEKRHYDYDMRDIFIDHIVVVDGDGIKGRCTFPNCGVGVDTMMQRISFKEDKVVQRGDKWCVIHCHGEEEGEIIKCFDTEAEAQAMHRAIEAQKHGSTQEVDQGEKPPKDWMDNCKAVVSENMPNYSEEQVNAVCGNIWYHKPEQQGIGDTAIDMLRELIKKGGIKKKMSVKNATELKELIKQRMNEGCKEEEAEDYFKPYVSAITWQEYLNSKQSTANATQVKVDTALVDATSTPAKLNGAQEQEPPEKTPLEKCVAEAMGAGKTEPEATDWCKAELAGEHQQTDSLIERSKKLISLREQNVIEKHRNERRHPL